MTNVLYVLPVKGISFPVLHIELVAVSYPGAKVATKNIRIAVIKNIDAI